MVTTAAGEFAEPEDLAGAPGRIVASDGVKMLEIPTASIAPRATFIRWESALKIDPVT